MARPRGEEMAEVYSVHIIKSDGDWECPTEIYGTITSTDSVGQQIIYSRSEENAQTIKAGDTALMLTGPERFILGYDFFDIELSLTLKDKNNRNDDDIIRGDILWCLPDFCEMEKGRVYERKFHGKYGATAIVKYAVFRLAVMSTVQVTLIKGGPAQFYGELTACGCNIPEKIVLLHSTKDEPFDVSNEQQIKLSRSVLAVRSRFLLTVEAHLFDKSNGSEIFNGIIRFQPKLYETTHDYFRSDLYEIKVSVIWEADIDYRKYCSLTPEELARNAADLEELYSPELNLICESLDKEEKEENARIDQLRLPQKRGHAEL